ncbi:DUF3817 domain-containing protein [Cryptosporangium minutisporangium]|uniref:DUF3817 domain-containing protein n=1 Tax=Cryptosporangium minutisporangium TaxID=113569 RepID=A0ABP6T1F0_9ACTN
MSNTSATTPSTTTFRLFRLAALAEALSWTGLLIGMVFKYLIVENEIGVKIFGPIHGALFILYLVSVLLTRPVAGWSLRATFVGLIASIPPFGTLFFERWAMKKASERTPTSAGV